MFGVGRQIKIGFRGTVGIQGRFGAFLDIKTIKVFVAVKGSKCVSFVEKENPFFSADWTVNSHNCEDFRKFTQYWTVKIYEIPVPNLRVIEQLAQNPFLQNYVQNFLDESDYKDTKNALQQTFCKYEFEESGRSPSCQALSYDKELQDNSFYYDYRKDIKYVRFLSNLNWLAQYKTAAFDDTNEKINSTKLLTLQQDKEKIAKLLQGATSMRTQDVEYFTKQCEEIDKEILERVANVSHFAQQREKHKEEEKVFCEFLQQFVEVIRNAVSNQYDDSVADENICVFYC